VSEKETHLTTFVSYSEVTNAAMGQSY